MIHFEPLYKCMEVRPGATDVFQWASLRLNLAERPDLRACDVHPARVQ